MKKNGMRILDLYDYASSLALQKPSYYPFLNEVDYGKYSTYSPNVNDLYLEWLCLLMSSRIGLTRVELVGVQNNGMDIRA